MKRLLRKVKTTSGASILLALMLLLVCMTVAASMMAAASSDTGKYRSVRAQQQKYLTLSSGVGVLRDALSCTTCYVGKYNVYEWTEEIRTRHTSVDPITGDTYEYFTSVFSDYFYVKQLEGEMSCYGLEDFIGLKDDLDHAFGDIFDASGAGYERLAMPLWTSGAREFRIVVPEGLPGYPDGRDMSVAGEYEASRTVMVKSELNARSFHITSSIWLGSQEDTDYRDIPTGNVDTMFAELHPAKTDEGVSTVPSIEYEPAGRLPGIAPYESGVTVDNVNTFKYMYASSGGSAVDMSDSDSISSAFGDPARTTSGTSWFVYWVKKGVA